MNYLNLFGVIEYMQQQQARLSWALRQNADILAYILRTENRSTLALAIGDIYGNPGNIRGNLGINDVATDMFVGFNDPDSAINGCLSHRRRRSPL